MVYNLKNRKRECELQANRKEGWRLIREGLRKINYEKVDMDQVKYFYNNSICQLKKLGIGKYTKHYNALNTFYKTFQKGDSEYLSYIQLYSTAYER